MPGKKPPLNAVQMIETEQQNRSHSKLYRQMSAEFIDGQISDMVEGTAQELERAAKMEPLSLTDTNRLISITLDYVRACASSSTLPSIVGLSRALGHSRQSIYDAIERNSPKAAARWLTMCKESFAELLSASALRNGTNTITSIFLFKSIYGYKESNEIVIKNDQYQILTDEDRAELQQNLMQRYAELPED